MGSKLIPTNIETKSEIIVLNKILMKQYQMIPTLIQRRKSTTNFLLLCISTVLGVNSFSLLAHVRLQLRTPFSALRELPYFCVNSLPLLQPPLLSFLKHFPFSSFHLLAACHSLVCLGFSFLFSFLLGLHMNVLVSIMLPIC